MKNLIIGIIVLMTLSCGHIEKSFDAANYESLTNEKGTLVLYSGGVVINKYVNAKIIYSDSDSFAIWFTTGDNKTLYWQGEVLFIMK